MPPARKRKRRKPRWGPILVVVLLANLAAGIAASKVTRVGTMRVEGVPTYDQGRIRDLLQDAQDLPILKLDVRRLEWNVLQKPEVESAEVSVNPFGYGLLRAKYRRPVVRLEGTAHAVMDASGVLFVVPESEIPKGLPTLRLDRTAPPALLTVAGDWPAYGLAAFAEKVRTLRPNASVGIEVDDRAVVCLNMGAGRVVLGSMDDLDKKLAVLRDLLARKPSEFDRVAEINLTQPDRPAFVPRKAPPASPRSPR